MFPGSGLSRVIFSDKKVSLLEPSLANLRGVSDIIRNILLSGDQLSGSHNVHYSRDRVQVSSDTRFVTKYLKGRGPIRIR
jgi:hypothetical protein